MACIYTEEDVRGQASPGVRIIFSTRRDAIRRAIILNSNTFWKIFFFLFCHREYYIEKSSTLLYAISYIVQLYIRTAIILLQQPEAHADDTFLLT